MRTIGREYLDAMGVGGVGPARRRQRYQVMREVDEDVNEVPMPNRVCSGVAATLHPQVVGVPALHVVAHEDPTAGGKKGGGGRERDGGAVEGEMKRAEVRAGGEGFEAGDGIGDRGRGLRRVEGRIPWLGVGHRGAAATAEEEVH